MNIPRPPPRIETMDELNTIRLEAASEGRFADAQHALDQMRMAAAAKGDEIQEQINTHRGTKLDQILESQRRQLLEFTRMWENCMEAYEVKSNGAIVALREQHGVMIREQEELLRCELNSRKPHYSRRVLNLRDNMQRLSDAKHYREAEDIQKSLIPMEREELRKFDEQLSVEFAAQSKRWRERCRKEMQALRYKIEIGRQQHREQRRRDYEQMVLKHHNATTETQQRSRTRLSKARNDLQRQIESFRSAPRRTQVQFSDFTNILMEM